MHAFATPGPEGTKATIEAVRECLGRRNIERVVVATTTGRTAVAFAEALPDVQIVAVTHNVGFHGGDEFELEASHAEALERLGVPIVTCLHALSGVGRSISRTFGGITGPELIAHALRMLGQGMKVCVECAAMAADAGALPTDRDAICVGGTGRGADTAVVLRPAHAGSLLDLRIREVLCLPKVAGS